MAMFKPSQSHKGGVIVKPYTGNIAQELQFRTGQNSKKKTTPFFLVIKFCLPVVLVGLGYLCEDIQLHQPHSSSRGTREVASSYVRVHPTQTSSDYL